MLKLSSRETDKKVTKLSLIKVWHMNIWFLNNLKYAVFYHFETTLLRISIAIITF